jgi:hypothetical protein
MAWQLVICAVRAWEAAEIVGCSPLRRTVGLAGGSIDDLVISTEADGDAP